MKRLTVLLLVLVLFTGPVAGCETYFADDNEGWTASDEGSCPTASDHMHVDPEIEARAELY